MDSDLSLIQIAGEEDDSLLLHGATTDDAFFLVSPLRPPRPRPKEVAKANELDRKKKGGLNMVSSSLKRPATVNTIKSATKEPKDSKLPVTRALSKTSKNVMTVGASDIKRNQVAHHVNLNNTKTVLHNAKVGSRGKFSTAKSCVRPTRRNVANYVKSSPTKAECPPVKEANSGLEVLKKQVQPSTSQTSYDRDDRAKKQEQPSSSVPSDAVPFSDEWLAAIEAAGEEILAKKGGAVQNSPLNKSPPQLGPYSPVKRMKNLVIGPFDCTKYSAGVV